MQLTNAEKLILIMLSDIHKHLKIKGEIDPDFVLNTIADDQQWGFEWKYHGVLTDAETPQEVKETCDILDMYRVLQSSYKDLSAADKQRVKDETGESDVKFPGFDANNEKHYHIAKYLVDHLGRYSEPKDATKNSHGLMVEMYDRMLEVFWDIKPKLLGLLTVEQIIAILKAQVHPSMRD